MKPIFIVAHCFFFRAWKHVSLCLLLLIKGLCIFCGLCSFLSCVCLFLPPCISRSVFSLFFIWNKGSSELGVKLCRSPLGWSENNTSSYFGHFCTHLWPENERDYIISEQPYILFIENCIRTANLGLKRFNQLIIVAKRAFQRSLRQHIFFSQRKRVVSTKTYKDTQKLNTWKPTAKSNL